MASKSSANSSDNKPGTVKRTSRKTIRRTTAPLALKADDGDEDRSKRKRRSAASKDTSADPDSTASDKDNESGEASWAEAEADRAEAEADRAEAQADRVLAEAEARADEAPAMHDAEGTSEPGQPEAAPEAHEDRKDASPQAADPAALRDRVPTSVATPTYATLLPPQAIGSYAPDSPAPPPGRVPPGDSRSLRRFRQGAEEFVLIYRFDSFLIKRAGLVGQQGTWTVVEYPHIGAAAHAYAQECSTLTGAGYYDLR